MTMNVSSPRECPISLLNVNGADSVPVVESQRHRVIDVRYGDGLIIHTAVRYLDGVTLFQALRRPLPVLPGTIGGTLTMSCSVVYFLPRTKPSG